MWKHFSQCFPVSNTENIVSSVSFCFQDANYAYAIRQGILTKIRACEHLQNFCEHEQASPHLIFASNSSKGQILRALPNWMGPFDTPITEKAKEELLERNSYCISSFRLHRSFEVSTENRTGLELNNEVEL